MPRSARVKNRERKKNFRFLLLFMLTILILFAGFFYFKFAYGVKIISPVPEFIGKSKTVFQAEDKKKMLQEALTKNKIDFSTRPQSSDDSIIIELKDGGVVNFDQDKNINEQISSLQLMLSRFTIEGKRIDKLDFRFDNPVVKFRK